MYHCSGTLDRLTRSFDTASIATQVDQGSLRKARNKAEALACVGSLFKAKLKAVTVHVMYHSTQQSNACEESTLTVRERCVSRIAEKGIKCEPVAHIESGGRQPRGKAESQEGGKNLVEALHKARSRRK
eukprot:795256-Pleurochrysis_carterae.AAC.3